MRIRVLYLAIGTGLGISSHYSYRQYKPQRTYTSSTQQMISSYIAKHKLQQGYLVTVLNTLGFILKGFYSYGMITKLKGFNYNQLFLKKDEVGDEQKQITELYCIFSPNEYLCGHPEIQHGGATATIIDQNLGVLTVLNSKSSVATVDLHIKYKRPIKKDQFYVLEGRVIEKIGRKIKVKGIIKQLQTGEVKVETQGIFFTVNWDNQLTRILKMFFQTVNFKNYSDIAHITHIDYHENESQKLKQKYKQFQKQRKSIGSPAQKNQQKGQKKLPINQQISQIKSSFNNKQIIEAQQNARLQKLQTSVRKIQQRQNLVQIRKDELQQIIQKHEGNSFNQK